SWHAQTFGLGETDRFSLLSGLSHDPLLRDVFAPLCLGATLCIPDVETMSTPGLLAEWIRREGVTVTHLTPAMATLLTVRTKNSGVVDAETSAPTSLRYVFLGGDTLTRGDLERLRTIAPSATFVNFYGATETPQAMGYFIVPNRSDNGLNERDG